MADEIGDRRGDASESYFAKQQLIDSARTAFQFMSALLKNRSLYPESHPILLTAADKLRSKIQGLLVGRKEVAFYLVGGELFFEKISILIDLGLVNIIEHFASRDVGGIAFKPGLTSDDLIRFATVMNREASFLSSVDDFNRILSQEQIKHIELHRVLLVDKQTGSAIKAGKQKASEVFRNAVDVLKEMVQAVQLDKAANTRKTNTIIQTMVDNILNNRDAFLGLTNLKMYDEYTFAHSVNVSILAVSLGTFLSMEKPQIAALGIAGLMHDIGKVNIPPEIINKPGKLDEREWEAMKRHPIEGALILAGKRGISKLAMVAAFEHHQHSGQQAYPKPAAEHSQHPFSQIITLVDAYEAITAMRVYYKAQTPPDEGIRILLKKRGNPFNPVLVNAFVKMMGVFPVGSVVRLDTGETGLVMHQTGDLVRPRVLILTAFDGSEKGEQPVSLLETRNSHYKRSITGTVDPYSAKIDIKKYLE